jgi:hypothetical protein
MEAIATQLAAMIQQQLLATQSAQGAATTLAASGHNAAPSAREGVQQQQHRQQRARLDDYASPLENNVILDIVFSYVGIGDYFYTAAVCRNWRGRYITLCCSTASPQPHKLYTSYKVQS